MNQGQASYILGYCFVFNFLYNVIVTGGGGGLVEAGSHTMTQTDLDFTV